MKERFKKAFLERVKDYGLSERAIDEMAELAIKNMATDASDAVLSERVEAMLPFAKLVQAEGDRRLHAANSVSLVGSAGRNEGQISVETGGVKGQSSGGNVGGINAELEQAMQRRMDQLAMNLTERIDLLEAENRAYRVVQARKAREDQVFAYGHEIGIPDFMLKRLHIPEDADFKKVLSDYKQELVNSKLLPTAVAFEIGNSGQEAIAMAKAWAEGLPDGDGL